MSDSQQLSNAARFDKQAQDVPNRRYYSTISRNQVTLLSSDEDFHIPPPPPSSSRTLSKDTCPMPSPGISGMAFPQSRFGSTEVGSIAFSSHGTFTTGATKGSFTDHRFGFAARKVSHVTPPRCQTPMRTVDDQETTMPFPACNHMAALHHAQLHAHIPDDRIRHANRCEPEQASFCSTRVDPSSPRQSWTFSQTSTMTSSPNSSFGRTTGKRIRGTVSQRNTPSILPSPSSSVFCGNQAISEPMPFVAHFKPWIGNPKPHLPPQTPRTSWHSSSHKRIISPPIPLRPPPPSRCTSQERQRPSLYPYHRAAPKPPTKKPSRNSLSSKKYGPLRQKSLQFLENLPSFMDLDSEGEEGCGLARLWSRSKRGRKMGKEESTRKGGKEERREREGSYQKDKVTENKTRDGRIHSRGNEQAKEQSGSGDDGVVDTRTPPTDKTAPETHKDSQTPPLDKHVRRGRLEPKRWRKFGRALLKSGSIEAS